ncbi:poly-gamma-glutamate hydrolase family protein [Shewanella sp. GutCb]|uniref:poly-gamma-glutamate hydrolase family protein n=1 Tax=Shewanella sp. GutCb TaxID=2058315 RepID=UPI0015E0DB07|nr:poly-gamma-glutamate hydrolase family protein [Shewanella sp. GutCb]
MVDKYSNFEDLANSEIAGRDFVIKLACRESKTLVIAPHAGAIEPGTSEITLAIARDDTSYYLFEGVKEAGNGKLHITSTNFDEPQALKIAASSDFTIAIHGEASDNEIVYLGGRNKALQSQISASLKKAGFKVDKHTNSRLQGTSKENICNRCASASGVQLELGKGLRKTFFKNLTPNGRKQITEELEKFTTAVRDGMNRVNSL